MFYLWKESIWKVHVGLACSPTPKHTVGTQPVACFPRSGNGTEACRTNPSYPVALLRTVGRTEPGRGHGAQG